MPHALRQMLLQKNKCEEQGVLGESEFRSYIMESELLDSDGHFIDTSRAHMLRVHVEKLMDEDTGIRDSLERSIRVELDAQCLHNMAPVDLARALFSLLDANKSLALEQQQGALYLQMVEQLDALPARLAGGW